MAPATSPKQEVFHLRPSDTGPGEERFKLSLFDPIILVVYCHFTLFMRLEDDEKPTAVSVLKEGLEKTLGQVRHLCSTLEKDEEGGFSFVKKPDTTVKYVVKHLDTLNYPSIQDLEKATFSCRSLGPDIGVWGVEGMPYGEGRPESNPYNSPITSGFQLNLVRGGAVFSSNIHHWGADLVGWSNFVRQLADNCRAIQTARQTSTPVAWPAWDPACIDVKRFCRAAPKESLVDGPPVAPKHPGHPAEQQALLFHLPGCKAAQLKQRATPADGSFWVSTYDATCAFVWRCLTRARIPYFQPASLAERAPWVGESVNMRTRFRNPTPPPRMIRNMLAGGFSELFAEPLPTLGEVAGEGGAPLSRPAGYIRRLTDSVTQESVEGLLDYIATLKDQQSVSFNLASKPPMSFFVTDHRPADVAGCDFGFGQPITHRFLTGNDVSPNMTLVYPPPRSADKKTEGGDDSDGTIWSITVEKDIISTLMADPEWCEYMEYRGID